MFSAEFTKCMRIRGSSYSLEDVRDKALMLHASLYGVLKHYAIWTFVKDMLKFQGGIAHALSKKKNCGDYMSNGGADPVDLNKSLYEEESSGTPVSTGRRPSGNKAAKGKEKTITFAPQALAPVHESPYGNLVTTSW